MMIPTAHDSTRTSEEFPICICRRALIPNGDDLAFGPSVQTMLNDRPNPSTRPRLTSHGKKCNDSLLNAEILPVFLYILYVPVPAGDHFRQSGAYLMEFRRMPITHRLWLPRSGSECLTTSNLAGTGAAINLGGARGISPWNLWTKNHGLIVAKANTSPYFPRDPLTRAMNDCLNSELIASGMCITLSAVGRFCQRNVKPLCTTVSTKEIRKTWTYKELGEGKINMNIWTLSNRWT
ncbi:hypothetical protein DFH29DRAFT_878181 [Suillus ampliporus]|nr:hypothetical protein DFH29DRAFT_878181 [Suillus ampliporus]